MTVDSVPAIDPADWTAYSAASGKADGAGRGLGKNDFLKLLVTQLRYQDILSPGSQTEYLSQMAQLTTMEQIQNLNDSVGALVRMQVATQAYGLIGRSVEATTTDGKAVSGKVTGVQFEGGLPTLLIGDVGVPLPNVVRIT